MNHGPEQRPAAGGDVGLWGAVVRVVMVGHSRLHIGGFSAVITRLDDAAYAVHMHFGHEQMEKMSKIGKICVYCGSGPGTDPAFVAAATAFGEILAKNGIELVYGGGAGGMMGDLAKSVRAHGGEFTGIIPEFLTIREHAKRDADHLIVTKDMHERKRKMFELADAFVAMP